MDTELKVNAEGGRILQGYYQRFLKYEAWA